MIRSFRCPHTERLFRGERARKFVACERIAQRKLAMLAAAHRLEDLNVPPGNWLEKLAGDRSGQYSIRVNDQWRLCFRWSEGSAFEVEMADYH